MTKHDVVIIGGGHNGLVTAAYLSKAGLDVCVVEAQEWVGGSSMTRELTLPGFKHDWGSVVHIELIGNPLLKDDELGLKSKYGLKYVKSFTDAEVFPKFCEFGARVMRAADLATLAPPPSFSAFVSSLEDSEDGREYLKALFSNPIDIAEDWFSKESKRVGKLWIYKNEEKE